MARFTCPVAGCKKELTKLQVMHFRSYHNCDPWQWVEANFGPEIRSLYAEGRGTYAVSSYIDWLSRIMVETIVETRSHSESLSGDNNPMRREEVRQHFLGENNPAKRPDVREKISEALKGHEVSPETRAKISEKNRGKTISKEHRQAVSEAAKKIDRSYTQTKEFSEVVSNALKGREPTYPKPYTVDEIPHFVRSTWEEEIARMLIDNEIEYEYEKRFNLGDRAYYPDFVFDEIVIEVKGYARPESISKAKLFMEQYPSYKYVVVGDEIPCHIHIPWENRSELIQELSDD